MSLHRLHQTLRVFLWLSLFLTLCVVGAKEPDPDNAPWSTESNGLQARLSMRRLSIMGGTARIATYLEIKNASGGSALILKSCPLTFTLTDSEGRDVPMTGGAFDGPYGDPPPLLLPQDSTLRFRIGPSGWGIGGDQAAALDLGIRYYWTIPHDGKSYFLQGTLKLPPQKRDKKDKGIPWEGKLDLPRVRIPTEPDVIDPKTIGPRIDELGPKLFDPHYNVSESAIDELSLIDDPRVIPWYIKAVKSDSYSLRFAALDRLCRMEGDEALAGLKIGMSTSGADMGHCTTKEGAEGLAVNIRHSAAIGLARSVHPQAKALLWTMEKDASYAVRLTVIQTAATVDTPEALAILQRGTKDADKMVQDEAGRLLAERKKSRPQNP